MSELLPLELLFAHRSVSRYAWTSDGMLAFVWESGEQGHIWLTDANGRWPRQLTTQHGRVVALAVSPDGTQVAYSARVGGNLAIWQIAIAGGTPLCLTPGQEQDAAPSWSPDGRQIVYVSTRDNREELMLVPAGGGRPRPLLTLPYDCTEPVFSPDGAYVAFVANPRGELLAGQIGLIEVETGAVRLLTDGASYDRSPRWLAGGKAIAYLSDRSGYDQVWQVAVATGAMEQVSEVPGEVLEFGVSPAGRLALAATHQSQGALYLHTDGRGAEPLDLPPGVAWGPAWLGDDTVAFRRESADSPSELWVCNGRHVRQITFSLTPGLGERMVQPVYATYPSSDGMAVPALLYRPESAASRGPAIVYPHGGPTHEHRNGWDPYLQFLVSNGYTVLAPNYRGSTGYGRAYELLNNGDWGGTELDDVVWGARFLRTLPEVDPQRVAIMGGSYGGQMTAIALGRFPSEFKAGVDLYGPHDRILYWHTTDKVGRRNIGREIGTPDAAPDAYRKASAIHWAQAVLAPILLLHGDGDPRVPLSQSERYYAALVAAGKVAELKIYPGEDEHGFLIPAHNVDAMRMAAEWLRKYV